MRSRWNEWDARKTIDVLCAAGESEALALRVYSTRLLGSDPALVLHGGGNTSLKSELADLNRRFSDIVARGSIRTASPFPPERNDYPELPRLAFRFDRFHYGRLRQLIDAINDCTG